MQSFVHFSYDLKVGFINASLLDLNSVTIVGLYLHYLFPTAS